MYNYNLNSCVRTGSIKEDEYHNCWFCGHPIKIQDGAKWECGVCHLMICPNCLKCFCNITKLEQEFLLWIHTNYCTNYEALKKFTGLINIPKKFVDNLNQEKFIYAIDCLLNCSKLLKSD